MENCVLQCETTGVTVRTSAELVMKASDLCGAKVCASRPSWGPGSGPKGVWVSRRREGEAQPPPAPRRGRAPQQPSQGRGRPSTKLREFSFCFLRIL